MRVSFGDAATNKWPKNALAQSNTGKSAPSFQPQIASGKFKAQAKNDRDGMMGSFLLDALFGGLLSNALTQALDMPDMDDTLRLSTATELYSEFNRDRHSAPTGLSTKLSHDFSVRNTNQKTVQDRGHNTDEQDFWNYCLADAASRLALEKAVVKQNRANASLERQYILQRSRPQSLSFH